MNTIKLNDIQKYLASHSYRDASKHFGMSRGSLWGAMRKLKTTTTTTTLYIEKEAVTIDEQVMEYKSALRNAETVVSAWLKLKT